jgi:TatD DNase family protein
MIVDSHCHLDHSDFDADRDAVLARAREAGVETILGIGEAHLRWEGVYVAAGVHPHEASTGNVDAVRGHIEHPRVVAVGEIGLDYHYNFSPPEVQREVFVAQLQLAREARKPVIIHTREAWDDTLALLAEHWDPALHGIMHCFSEGPEEAARALELGFFISFAGVVTFPKAQRVQAAARAVPLDFLLVETDAPYLAPVPRRGKRNEPAFVVHTAEHIARLRGETPERIAAATTSNFVRLFALR